MEPSGLGSEREVEDDVLRSGQGLEIRWKGKPKGFAGGSGVVCGMKERKSDFGALGFSSYSGGEVRWGAPRSSRSVRITSLVLDTLIHIQVEMLRWEEV